jgi:co-chaperonin GroES (HSP10)
MVMAHEDDPKEILMKELGDISDVEIFNNQVLCAVYIRPQKTKSGIFLTAQTVDEDKYQSKVGLVLKLGESAFDGSFKAKYSDIDFVAGEWAVFRPSDGWSVTVNGVLCRILDDVDIRGRIQQPDQVW